MGSSGKGILKKLKKNPINTKMEKDYSTLTTQVEYYMSDKNLEFDEFFYNEIESNAEHYISLDIIMNCNKIKKMNVSKEDLCSAVNKSELLELNSDKNSLRRKDKKLPEFKGTRRT